MQVVTRVADQAGDQLRTTRRARHRTWCSLRPRAERSISALAGSAA
jgi:hypothetical protein